MKGLIIWAQSDCRSMMGLYRVLRTMCEDVIVAIRDYKAESQRQMVGFRHEEFSDVDKIIVGDDYSKGVDVLNAHPGYNHLFGAYQNAPMYRKLINTVARRGCRVGILSESPCVMVTGIKGWLKENIYLPFIVRKLIKPVVESSDFIVNLSGDGSLALQRIGWRAEQIVPFGYFPPPVIGSRVVGRKNNHDFHILVTGVMTWHRAPDTVIKALCLLKKWKVPYRATFTQEGPMLENLKRVSLANELPVEFKGFVSIEELIKLYETCSVYVAAGRREPWGMRLNDALQCGAPLLVSSGMGGVQLVEEYGCGESFDADDYLDLACKLRRLIENEERYRLISRNAEIASYQISPELKAKTLVNMISSRFEGWF